MTNTQKTIKLQAIKFLSALMATLALPFLFLRALFSQSWRLSLPERLSFGGWSTLRYNASQPLIWVHAASVGEIAGASPLIARLREKYPSLGIHITTTSLTGKQNVKERKLCSSPCLLPLDHPWCVRRAINRIRPKLFLLFETELWPNLLFQLHQKKIPALLVNGRISDFSFPRYQFLRGFFSVVLDIIAKFFTQTDLDAQRFIKLGADSKRVAVTGSTKFDFGTTLLSEEERTSLRHALGILDSTPCLVAGSVRPGEDEMVLGAYLRARAKVADLQMIFAPRHPERFAESGELMQKLGIDFHRRSAGINTKKIPVVLLDTLGELRDMYCLASIAFIGGTMVNIGGHNPLEAACYKAALVVGPHTQNIREMLTLLERNDGVFVVKSSSELAERFIQLLTNEKLRVAMGAKAFQVWQENCGATEKVMTEIEGYL